MDTQMKKGILELCILQEISVKPRYGYELLQKISKAFPATSESGIYVILRRMHRDNCLMITYGNESGGPQRKYYSISPIGIERLNNGKENLHALIKAVTQLGLL